MVKIKKCGILLLLFVMLAMCFAIMPMQAQAARTTAPSSSNACYYSSSNPFYSAGYTGQCTWYVWGRAHEYTGSVQNLPRGNAGGWYSTNASNGTFKYGATPKEGSIMVTHKIGEAANVGHVAFVESVNSSTGKMVVSEYNWNISKGFETNTMDISATKKGSGHDILGYIYLTGGSSNSQNPIGVMDSCTVDSSLRSITMYGWAYDSSNIETSIECTVIATNEQGKERRFYFTADNESSDLVANGVKGKHRYHETFDLGGLMGDIKVELWGKNIGQGENTCLDVKNIHITRDYNPVSAIDGIVANSDRSITLYGWTYDHDDLSRSINVTVEVTGVEANITEKFVFNAKNGSVDLNNNGIKGNHRFHETIYLKQLSGDVKVRVTAMNIGKGIDILVCEKELEVKPLLVYENVMDPDSTVNYDINALTGEVKFRFREFTKQDCFLKLYVADELVVEHGKAKDDPTGTYVGYFVYVVDIDELSDKLVSQYTEDSSQTLDEHIKSKSKIRCELYNSSKQKIDEVEVPFVIKNYIIDDGVMKFVWCSYNFDANGGTLESEKVSVLSGNKVADSLPVPVRENYTFLGWYTAKEGGEKVTEDFVATEENSGITFYAQWSCNHPSYKSETTIQPNCKTEGEITYTCSVCGDSYIEETGYGTHVEAIIDAVPNSCTVNGSTEGKYCVICQEILVKPEVIAVTGHSFTTWLPLKEATCTEKGSEYTLCEGCGEYKERETDIKAHEDTDNDGACDTCDKNLTGEAENKNCSCNCHKSGFINFIFKIILFFQKLFGTNKTCACGIAHY